VLAFVSLFVVRFLWSFSCDYVMSGSNVFGGSFGSNGFGGSSNTAEP